ncbi:MAG TPA: DegT/DnrJ/EryC1/StrS family aminotransferase [Thermoleophilaceae bacterium]
MNIPLLDIHAQHDSIREELNDAIRSVVESGRYIGGAPLSDFESSFARFCGAKRAIGVSSGTDAVTLALRGCGVGPGDEVITTAFTFIATVESIAEVGANPVLVDVDPDTALATVDVVEDAISDKTAAILVVHLYGQPVDLPAFRELAERRGLALIEDAAQAHGAEFDGLRVGAVGRAAAFSFFPGKNLGALGDAGGITTGDGALADRIAALRDHGRLDKYRHEELGVNARMDTLQAAILAVKLKRLGEWNEARRRHATFYEEAFADVDGIEPLTVDERATHVYHQYVVRVDDRDGAVAALKAAGVAAGVHYPIPLHRQPALAESHGYLSLPACESLAERVLSLPVYPELTDEQRSHVAQAVTDHVRSRSGVAS